MTTQDLDAWAREKFPLVEVLEGFVMLGTADAGVAEAFATCLARFRWLIYDESPSGHTGAPVVRSQAICRALREGFAFAVGAKKSTDVIDQVSSCAENL